MERKMRKSITAALALLFCLLIAACGIPAMNGFMSARADSTVWDGDLSRWGSQTTATAPDTYTVNETDKTVQIGDADAFAYFAYLSKENSFAGYTVTLGDDINLGNNCWIPVGFFTPFAGTFNGNGHTVSSLSFKAFFDKVAKSPDTFYIPVNETVQIDLGTDLDCYGLFAQATNATISDLTVTGAEFDMESRTVGADTIAIGCAGVIVGKASDLSMNRCTVGSKDTAANIRHATVAGGLAGSIEGATTFESCKNHASVAGSIVGGLAGSVNATANVSAKLCLNYGAVEGTDVNGVAGGMIGKITGTGAVTLSGGNSGKVSGSGKVGGCVGEAQTAYYAGEYLIGDFAAKPRVELTVSDHIITGVANAATIGDFVVEIGDEILGIKEGAFIGLRNLVGVEFSGSGEITIGDRAFAGTRVSRVQIPEGVTVGESAFADCDYLTEVTLADNVTVAQSAFAGSAVNTVTLPEAPNALTVSEHAFDATALFVVENATQYNAYAETSFPYKDQLTFPVTIEYKRGSVTLDTQLRLFGQPYTLVQVGGLWVTDETVQTLGTNKTGSVVYPDNEITSTMLSVGDMNTLLKNSTGTVTVYVRDNLSGEKNFQARKDIVYDTKSYSPSNINTLLENGSDLIRAGMTVAITKFTDANGAEAANTEGMTICNAGTYTISVTEGSNTVTFELTVHPQEIDLTSADRLVWALQDGIELSGREGTVLYLYGKLDGTQYPSLGILDAEQRAAFGIMSDVYQTKVVKQSLVLNRGGVELKVADSLLGTAFNIKEDADHNQELSGNVAADAGVYCATVSLVADVNYRFVSGTADPAYGITVTVADEGKSATVEKVWYIAANTNRLVTGADASVYEAEYAVADRKYGTQGEAAVPHLLYGDVAAFGGANDPVTLTLFRNEMQVGEAFTRDAFANYINDGMPAGSYRLQVEAKAVTVETEGEAGKKDTLQYSAFTRNVTFTITAGEADLTKMAEIDALLKEKKFVYVWDDEPHFFDDAADEAIDAILKDMPVSVNRTGIWEDEQYNDLFGSFVIEYNLLRMQSDTYYAAEDLMISTADPGAYVVYYRVAAPNYRSSIDDLGAGISRTDYRFEVVIVKEVAFPVLTSKTYDGTLQKSDISDSELYTVKFNDGGTRVGSYEVVLEFREPAYYMWEGQTIDDKTPTCVLHFDIVQGQNRWEKAPEVVRWVAGKYNPEENTVTAQARFGTAVIVITDSNGNVFYNSAEEINNLKSAKAGIYTVTATVAGTEDYEAFEYSAVFRVLEKPSLAWWVIVLIIVGSIAVVAAVLFILWKKGVSQLLTGKLVVAIRTKATVDATIAAVRANKVAEAGRISVEQAKAREAEEAKAAEQATEPVATAESKTEKPKTASKTKKSTTKKIK